MKVDQVIFIAYKIFLLYLFVIWLIVMSKSLNLF